MKPLGISDGLNEASQTSLIFICCHFREEMVRGNYPQLVFLHSHSLTSHQSSVMVLSRDPQSSKETAPSPNHISLWWQFLEGKYNTNS